MQQPSTVNSNAIKKKIYLTIDDSPSNFFRQNLDFLIDHQIPAVFFCIGQQMEVAWEDLKYAIEQGYIIGNHSFTHPHFSEIDLATAKQEILYTHQMIQKLYADCRQTEYPKLFRFPYGDKGDGKYGFTFFDKKEVDIMRHPLTSKFRRFFKKEKGTPQNALAIQAYLRTLNYQPCALDDIDYPFFENLRKDIDWSWTLDVEEWKYKGESIDDFLKKINGRLQKSLIPDSRGKNMLEASLQNTKNTELVLLHDRDVTNELFRPILQQFIAMDVVFRPFDCC